VQSQDDARRAALIERLMCDFEVDLARFGGRGAYLRELNALEPLISDGVVSICGDRLLVPTPMRPFCRLVAQAFDVYAGGGELRHSRAI
jgi:oxygen-independent coproporphyrinogen-3 oxidase